MNEDNKKQVIAVSALGAVLVAVLVWQLLIKGVDPEAAPTTTATTTASNQTTPGLVGVPAAPLDLEEIDVKKLLAGIEQITFDYEKVKLDRPPMMPLAGLILGGKIERPQQPIITKKVTGIVWNQYNPVAVVVDNEVEVVGLGHVFDDGIIVDSIERDRVWFKIGDAKLFVELKEQ